MLSTNEHAITLDQALPCLSSCIYLYLPSLYDGWKSGFLELRY